MEKRQSRALLMAELRKLCIAKSTGTFIVITEGHVALFVLDEGSIVAVTFQGKKGENALPALQQITTGVARFHKGVKLAAATPLPTTEALLRYLEQDDPDSFSIVSLRQQSQLAQELPPQVKKLLETTLATFIGPMASLICPERLAEIRDIDEAIAILAKEIPQSELSRRFQNVVRSRL